MSEKQVKKKPQIDEIATTTKDIDIFAGWLARLENPDPVLLTEASGKGIKLYDEVARDPHAGSVLQTRYLALTAKEWSVIPAETVRSQGGQTTTSKEQKIADFVTDALEGMNFEQAVTELLQAILYGFYVGEVVWKKDDDKIKIKKIRAKHPRRFVFDYDRALKLLTPENMIEGVHVPNHKFLVFTYGSSDNPYGQGLGQKLWWPVWFKKNGIKFWLVFLEKFGMPTAIGKYPPGTLEDKQDDLLAAIDSIQTETGVAIPDTMAVDLLEAARGGTASYEGLCEYMDRQISKAVLGQTLTTEVGSAGSYAASQTHEGVRQDILKADATLFCEMLNETIIPWLVDYNFPNVLVYPRFEIRTEEEKDLKPLAERDKILVSDIGLQVGKQYFYDAYGIPEPEEGEETVAVQKEPSPGIDQSQDVGQQKKAAFSDAGDSTPTDTLNILGDKVLQDASLDPLIDPIKKLLEKSKSLPEFREALLSAGADMDDKALGAMMAKSLAVANLSGRYDVIERV